MKRLFQLLLLLVLLLSFFLTWKSYTESSVLNQMFESEIEALSYNNEGPGPQGRRQKQAVWCGGGGWVVRVGCCYGSEECTYINCPVNVFSCDGNTWIHF